MEHALWCHLPLLLQSDSKESIEYILQVLWRTRNTGLDSADREIIRGMLQLQCDAGLDPLLLCLRMLIRKCVRDNLNKDEIQKLFPSEVSTELQKLLALLLNKFLLEWREDIAKEKASLPRLKAMTCNMVDQNEESHGHAAIINLKLESEQFLSRETEISFQLSKDTLETMLESMYTMREQMTNIEENPNGRLQSQETTS